MKHDHVNMYVKLCHVLAIYRVDTDENGVATCIQNIKQYLYLLGLYILALLLMT